ncbi:trigger factor [Striga asiatica]|uniref:Trigger factor n=1 Tax=Striga asiatica TaxID=4170 RepID=A0A5A7NY15_STRAF|nr:trigger factor [Striga asiatica]
MATAIRILHRQHKVIERVEGDTVLGDQGKVGVGGVIEHGCGHEAAGGRDERWRGSLSSLGGDGFALEHAFEWGNLHIGIGVDVDVVVLAGCVGEEAFPERGEV